jgi:hypothetical protein
MSLTDREINQLKKIASIANELIGKAEANIITAGLKAAKAEEKKAKKASGKVENKEAKKSLPKDPEKAVAKLAKKAAKKAAKKVYPKGLSQPL